MIAQSGSSIPVSSKDYTRHSDSVRGNCFLIKVNHHIQQFNGTICRNAANVQCGASDTFRSQYCARGRDECYDMYEFAPQNPYFRRRINFDGAELLESINTGDLLIFWTYQTHNRGFSKQIITGVYLVDVIDVDDNLLPPVYTFYPKSDQYAYIDFPLPGEQIIRRALGPYAWVKQLGSNDIGWALNLIHEDLDSQARQMQGRKSYDEQIDVLDALLKQFDTDESSPMYAKLAEAGVLDMPVAPSLVAAPTTVTTVTTVTPPGEPKPAAIATGSAATSPATINAPAPATVDHKSPVERLSETAASNQLHYPLPLLTRFHISMATHPIVVLSGHSGTGKTQLARIYAEAEGASFGLGKVQPDWVSPSYLWGAYDYLAGAFAATEFAAMVRKAGDEWEDARQQGREPTKFVLCLDEMNLARVEYYLADVLSALEQPLGSRWIDLYSPALNDARGFPSRLQLTPNIRFVGTINVDETTYSLSPKVLDRAHMLRLDQVDLSALRALLGSEGSISSEVLDFVFLHLGEIHRRMTDDPTQQFGYRVARQIAEWVAVATQEPYKMPIETALDAEIAQKILPRLQIDPDSDMHMAMFEKLFAYFEQFERITPGFDETLRWMHGRRERLNLAEAVSGQQ